ncbi:hypothetical protein SFC57_09975 [Niallia circulans]|uniref:hypothetical protein n=1 Tax=Niallia circulans TaxID=1397 RepID=UPI00156181E8|nr:hypothetical protein [Niallia circulans]NRG30533.1 hypothetical protein [Niallia circulans]
MTNFLLTNLFSAFLLHRNLQWHRKLVFLAIPLFFLFMLLQGEYIIARLKKNTIHI